MGIGLCNVLQAQYDEIHLPNHDDKRFYFGISIAGSTNSFRVSHHPRFLADDSVLVAEPGNNLGFGLGITANFNISNRFEFRTAPFNLTFGNRNLYYRLRYPDLGIGETETSVKNVQSIVWSVPFQLKFKSDRIKNFRVYMFGGGKFEYDFASNANKRNAEGLVKLTKTDFGIEGGIGFNFYNQAFIFSPEIKISNGLRNRHAYDPNLKYSSVIDRISTRQVVFTINLEGVID
jgi:hypothetical protein